MKNLKKVGLGLLIAAIVLLATPNTSAQTVIKHFEYTNSSGFLNGVTPSSQLSVTSNWTARAVAPSCPSSTIKLCYIKVSYSGTNHPSLQQILDALRNAYVMGGSIFSDGQVFIVVIVVNGIPVTVTITVELKP